MPELAEARSHSNMVKHKPTTRMFIMGVCFFLVAAYGAYDMIVRAQETGVLRIGGRHVVTIIRASDPEKFDFNIKFLWGTCGFFSLLALGGIVSFFVTARKRQAQPNRPL